jgi:hypothetical protein
MRIVSGGGACLLAIGGLLLFGAREPQAGEGLSQAMLALAPSSMMDPAKVTGPESCKECHAAAFAAWQVMRHAMTFEDMHKKDNAKAYAEAMGVDSIKRGDLCLQCHYTVTIEKDKPKATSGVSCESCHGAAADWLTKHNDFGGDGMTRESESADHKAKRHAECDALGMIRKDRIDLIAENCLSCHTTPHEDLVNKTDHKAGSEFELVAWSQGEVRHNFLDQDTTNRVNPPERVRVMYVTGKLVELHVTMTNLGNAKQLDGEYAKAMSDRVKRTVADLEAIQAKVAIPEVATALAAVPKDATGWSAAAGAVKAAARAFVQANDGSGLAAIDGLLPTEYK